MGVVFYTYIQIAHGFNFFPVLKNDLVHILSIAVDMAVNFPQNYDYVIRDSALLRTF